MYRNYFWQDDKIEYPNDTYWRPDTAYPEYRYADSGLSSKNEVYEMIRNIFINLGLDKENQDTSGWNPLGEYIKPGQTVLIKPNLVKDNNAACEGERGMECLVTHPSIIRCIIDYVLIAIGDNGRIIVADAPVQGCNFPELRKKMRLDNLEHIYADSGKDIIIEDLRTVSMINRDGVNVTVQNDLKYKGVEVNLGEDSFFFNNKNEGRVRITNYDYHELNSHHTGDIQQYCISEACLMADVVVNLCKPKSHRKAGFTGALKNMIGVNTSKEYLPHHTKGSKESGKGDEYYTNERMAAIRSTFAEWQDIANKKERYTLSKMLYFTYKVINKLGRKYDNEKYREGSWWGNDTIWRTIIDVNKVVIYADKNGKMCNEPQRKMICFGDMIWCGEKEGPLLPSPKKVGGILFSDNAVVFDHILTKLMGFNQDKLMILDKVSGEEKLFLGDIKAVEAESNQERFKGKIADIKDNFAFRASDGWTGVIDSYKSETDSESV